MRYELGIMDRYAIAVTGSVMENASFFKATLDEQTDAEKLLAAVKTALEYHPLFKCKMCQGCTGGVARGTVPCVDALVIKTA